MRILILNYEFPPLGGGASPVSYEITKGYAQLGHTVDVVTMAYGQLPSYEKKDDVSIYRVRSGRSKMEVSHPWEQLLYLISGYFKARKLLKNKTYDLCHCHFLVPTGILALWLYKKFGLRYIVTSHGSDVPGHNLDRFTLLHRFTGPILRKIIDRAEYITTPSVYLKTLIEKNILKGKSLDKIITIHNGSASLLRQDIKKENIILSVGRMLPMKGFQHLITAFKKIKNDNWRLVIVGDGSYKKNLETLAGDQSNIIFTGWLEKSQGQLTELYNKAKIFAFFSKVESQGIVLVEAMSTGCALLAANASVIRETVSSDVGFVVDPKNSDEVELKLSELMNNEPLQKTFAQKSMERFNKLYRWPDIIKKYESLIKTNE
jgi:glycosyltransferase involved in cell wall biosynthesis